MADQNGKNDSKNKNVCKTNNKTSFRVDFESLMTNMATFSTSVALLPNKITGKNGKNGSFESALQHKNM